MTRGRLRYRSGEAVKPGDRVKLGYRRYGAIKAVILPGTPQAVDRSCPEGGAVVDVIMEHAILIALPSGPEWEHLVLLQRKSWLVNLFWQRQKQSLFYRLWKLHREKGIVNWLGEMEDLGFREWLRRTLGLRGEPRTVENTLEDVLRVPIVYYQGGISPYESALRSGYGAVRGRITEQDLYEGLLQHPEYFDEWQEYSWDKRCDGWYLDRRQESGQEVYVVGRTGRKPILPKPFPDKFRACACFIKRELDSMVGRWWWWTDRR